MKAKKQPAKPARKRRENPENLPVVARPGTETMSGYTGVVQVAHAPQSVAESLIAMAIDKNLDIEKLKELIALRNEEEARVNKREFFKHFALMQLDFLPALKTKIVEKNGKKLWAYCPIEEIQRVYQPILSRHGFSSRWTEESIKEGKEIREWCIISGYGHEERTPVEIPIMGATDFTNATQQRGVASSYGRRYSLMAALGIIIAGEDTDAQYTETVKEKSIIHKADKVVETEKKNLPKFAQAMQSLNTIEDPRLRISMAHLMNTYKANDAALDVIMSYMANPTRMKSASVIQQIEAEIKSGVAGQSKV